MFFGLLAHEEMMNWILFRMTKHQDGLSDRDRALHKAADAVNATALHIFQDDLCD